MEHKALWAPVISTDEAQGIVEHIIAVFGNVDEGGDRLHPGSFTKTITERLGSIRVLDQHNADSIFRVVGRPLAIQEVSRSELPLQVLERFPEATGGVKAVTQFLMDTEEGRGAFARLRAGAIDQWSFGYDVIQKDMGRETGPDGKPRVVRNIREVRLYEYSPVLWGMNPGTMTISAKSDDKASAPAMDLPLAERGRAWDAREAEMRVRRWAGAEDAPNARYRRAFFWYDEEKADNFTAYKLPFADVIGGELTAIPRGIFAVAAVLNGSHGDLDIPDDDLPRVKAHVARYYERMRRKFDDDSIVVPWEKGEKSGKQRGNIEGLARHLSDRYGSDPEGWFTRCMNAEETADYDEDTRAAVCAVAHYYAVGKWPGAKELGIDEEKAEEAGGEEKAGRRLRADRIDQIKQIREAIAIIEDFLAWAEYMDEDEDENNKARQPVAPPTTPEGGAGPDDRPPTLPEDKAGPERTTALKQQALRLLAEITL